MASSTSTLNNDIAVVGYSLKVAGADDAEEFWNLLCTAESQHREVPLDKIPFESYWRKIDPNRRWYGNFLNDSSAFDHKFFKKSPREVASQDPQQRLMMEVAYQAVQQSGYFSLHDTDQHVGCYLGVCNSDYETNVACHEPNAFTTTGNLRSFIAGKISHYFGWTGPSMTLDSGCSTAAVSVHMACQAILAGECTAALAGGVNVMTNGLWFQNLAGASFLSPTGACKPFDASADGYCRGEAAAVVFLKKMSQAVNDGDVILGCISGTAVYQNLNCTPIFVPNSPSLSSLFAHVTQKAGLDPQQISLVEAHGTGTAVGDPAEYSSILEVFGGLRNRQTPMTIGSVKGLVGHTESASGAVALIKVLLMIQEQKIPPQASFQSLSPHLKASSSDMLEIATSMKDWNVEHRAALINNYGASGSNASLVVTQPRQHDGAGLSAIHAEGLKHPFWLSALDGRSLLEYVTKLRGLIWSKAVSARNITLANLSFNANRQSNHNLPTNAIFSANSISDLEDSLTACIEGTKREFSDITKTNPTRPVILCFGGQVSRFIGLDRNVFDGVRVLRDHLNHCDSTLQDLGYGGLYPEIFQTSPVEDPVKLQTMLFALQYSVARTWIDCGVKVAAVVGHSFGELVALCVSGALKFEDALRAIATRAGLLQKLWGRERGAMMAIEGDLNLVERLLAAAHQLTPAENAATIACYNGPQSFTLAGSSKAIDAVSETVSRDQEFSSMRTRRLNVTHAFHSTLVEESLLQELRKLGESISFSQASIPMERATETANEPLTSSFFAQHMRNPVYFDHAIQRLAMKYPSAIFLEAGSNSTITGMARRALGVPAESHFQAVNITDGAQGLNNLTDMTTCLWKEGLNVTYWPHHRSQTYDYGPILMPVYQFERSKHWLEVKIPQEKVSDIAEKIPDEPIPECLYTFVGYQDPKQRLARFRINTATQMFRNHLKGHTIAQTAPICPMTLEVDMAIEALGSLQPALRDPKHIPRVHNIQSKSPLCDDSSRAVWLDLRESEGSARGTAWEFCLASSGESGSAKTVHVSGEITFGLTESPDAHAEFARYGRLIGNHKRCLQILNSSDADDIIQGRNIYRAFSEVVDYGVEYQGLQKLVGKGNESAGRVLRKHAGERWLDMHLSDCFAQVGGIWVNCMTDLHSSEMYIANGLEHWLRSPKTGSRYGQVEAWDIIARHHHLEDEKAYMTDVFVFDSATGELAEIMLGIKYTRVSKQAMSRMLTRLTPRLATKASTPLEVAPPVTAGIDTVSAAISAKISPAPKPQMLVDLPSSDIDVSRGVKAVLAELSGLDAVDIKDSTQLCDIGIDSLMSMEMGQDLEQKFHCSIPMYDLADLTTVRSLVDYIRGTVTAISSEDDHSSSAGSVCDVFSDSATTVSSDLDVSIAGGFGAFLAEFLGVVEHEIRNDIPLGELGVDSLLSMELSADLECKFGLHFPHGQILQELTVTDIERRMNKSLPTTPGVSTPSELASPTPAPETAKSYFPDRDLQLPSEVVIDAFTEVKDLTDEYIAEFNGLNYMQSINPTLAQMCVALIVEALEQLGCSLRAAVYGQVLPRVEYLPKHERLVEYIYQVLQNEGKLVKVEGNTVLRTHAPAPVESSESILNRLIQDYPDHTKAHQLAYFTGRRLADVLSGKADGLRLIFGNEEGRQLVSSLYGDFLFNKLHYKMMDDFLRRLIERLPSSEGPLKIMEMGAGTGGTTKQLVPALARLNIPVEYTFTDISPLFLASARKEFKQHPFMKFRVHDIEKAPADDLLSSQHIIIASNAVHATRSLTESTKNIRKALRPDGFLMMLEMTQPLVWIDMIFGLLEGWWLFDDGRRHAVADPVRWETALHAAGYGQVNWTNGNCPEVGIERIVVAMASQGPRYEHRHCSLPQSPSPPADADLVTRQAVVDGYIRQYTQGFSAKVPEASRKKPSSGAVILVTGATGGLGCQLVSHLAHQSNVATVICLNRPARNSKTPSERQHEALSTRGITMGSQVLSKLRILETDTSKPFLGLSQAEYAQLALKTTHIIHNAWPMSGKRPVEGFEPQFQVMRNLLDFASYAYSGSKIHFQLISSIATVGHYPIHTGNPNVPESRLPLQSVLTNGYGLAKFICERMLDETLHRYPDMFQPMTVRLGQVAGSRVSGYWNPQEHLPFLLKSSQTLGCLPNLRGTVSWTPVEDVAATLGDLLLSGEGVEMANRYPVYHIENPIGQPWEDMIPLLAEGLRFNPAPARLKEGQDSSNKNGTITTVPFEEWIRRVRTFAGPSDENPASLMVDFLEEHFRRMSCGGLRLETVRCREHSTTLAGVGLVDVEVVRQYLQSWKKMGFLR
ncbi:ketoacyl-synt-domain-containing protein [Aspergillus brunneoviolaceus CBS 621.78]|uniref:Ketoacyl-synt-domain-containing protein n=1 Tax=Aspergillus brunneoviolaceus CBS 621.78 TaxID=1450534 RepID=A0ACD1FWN7_9EURO|nr:ketoacyl-synt-domain-containing protein [Aspergillus brunneoviolaceus CBS 621.78]RAH41341.1 ketoacyl-synt-domain-containing protein [Aspergillus brunneoviolaceus CBS 621.78]